MSHPNAGARLPANLISRPLGARQLVMRRVELGITQRVLADEMGVSDALIARAENPQRQPSTARVGWRPTKAWYDRAMAAVDSAAEKAAQ